MNPQKPSNNAAGDDDESTRQSLAYSAVGGIGTKLAYLLGFVVLARVLSPYEFGLMAIIVVFITILGVLIDLGFDAAIVQHPSTIESQNCTAFWIHAFLGLSTTAALMLSAGLISRFFDNDALGPIVQVSAVVLFLNAISIVPLSLLKKRRKFRLVANIELGASIGSLGVAIVLAFLDFGVWSLVAMVISGGLIQAVLRFKFSNWHPGFVFRKSDLKHLFAFGAFITGSRVYDSAASNLDKFLIGKFLSTPVLGAYRMAFQIVELPVQVVSTVFHRVFFSLYSALGNEPGRVREIHLRATRGVAFFTFPALLGLSVLSQRFVSVIFGEQWAQMAPILAFLAVISLFRNIFVLNDLLYLSQGETRLQFRVSFFFASNVIVGVAIGVQFGIIGLLWGLLVARMLNLYPAFYYSGRLVGIAVPDAFRNLGKIILASLSMALILRAIQLLWSPEAGSWGALAILATVGAASYLGLSYIIMKGQVRETFAMILGRAGMR